MQKALVSFSMDGSRAPSTRPQAYAIPPLSPLGLLIAFYLLPSSPITFAKIVKLFLEPLGIFVLLSGMWSRPYPSGAGAARAGAAASRSSALVVSAGPTTFYSNHH